MIILPGLFVNRIRGRSIAIFPCYWIYNIWSKRYFFSGSFDPLSYPFIKIFSFYRAKFNKNYRETRILAHWNSHFFGNINIIKYSFKI